MERACGMHGQEEKCIHSFGGGTPNKQTNKPLERFRHRFDGMFKMDLDEIRWKGT